MGLVGYRTTSLSAPSAWKTVAVWRQPAGGQHVLFNALPHP